MHFTLIFFMFEPMRGQLALIFVALLASVAAPQSRPAPTLFFDAAGNAVTNNEFVDIRMANFNYRDATVVRKLDDGTTEFRLQKVPQEGTLAPAFSLKTLDGKTLTSADLTGKVVVLNFWFIGCPACAGQEVGLNSLRKRFDGERDVVFIAAASDSAGRLRKYLTSQQFDYTQTADAQGVIDAFGSQVYPRNIVIGRDGRIVYWRTVVHAWDKFESVIRAEVAK